MAGNKGYEGCEICGKELLLFKCKYCGKAFCEQHKAPEKHDCPGLEEYRRLQAMGVIAKPGGMTASMPAPGPAESPEPAAKGHPKVDSLYKKSVVAVKLMSVVAVMAASVLALILLIGYINVNTPTWSYSIPVANSTDAGVVLVNYKNATDPTWEQLMAFLKTDDTIDIKYEYPTFTCADFARTLHDKAEAKGIKCGFVAVEFLNRTIDYSNYDNGDGNFSPPVRSTNIGHAVNVFKTTDGRTVYVDASSQPGLVSDKPEVRIAYIEEGMELNEIDLDWVTDLNYSFYESYKNKQLSFIADQRAYYRDRAAFDAKLTGANNITTELKVEGDQLNARAIELNARKSRIGPFYFPIGIVKEAPIYW